MMLQQTSSRLMCLNLQIPLQLQAQQVRASQHRHYLVPTVTILLILI